MPENPEKVNVSVKGCGGLILAVTVSAVIVLAVVVGLIYGVFHVLGFLNIVAIFIGLCFSLAALCNYIWKSDCRYLTPRQLRGFWIRQVLYFAVVVACTTRVVVDLCF